MSDEEGNILKEVEKASTDLNPGDIVIEPLVRVVSTEPEHLRPRPPGNRAPSGIRTFTIYRMSDETGVSGDGIIIEGVVLATGQAIIHWLTPFPRGSIAVFDSLDDFTKIHINPHPGNKTIITFEDGEQIKFGEE
jgi:hypothetical protein